MKSHEEYCTTIIVTWILWHEITQVHIFYFRQSFSRVLHSIFPISFAPAHRLQWREWCQSTIFEIWYTLCDENTWRILHNHPCHVGIMAWNYTSAYFLLSGELFKDPLFNLSNQFCPSEQASMKWRMSINHGTDSMTNRTAQTPKWVWIKYLSVFVPRSIIWLLTLEVHNFYFRESFSRILHSIFPISFAPAHRLQWREGCQSTVGLLQLLIHHISTSIYYYNVKWDQCFKSIRIIWEYIAY